MVHQTLAKKYSVHIPKVPYYKYQPASVIENKNAAMYWDRQIIADRPINAKKSDIVVLNWQNKPIGIINVINPLIQNIQTAYSNKIANFKLIRRRFMEPCDTYT
uniref:Uncharacterized protein n=1 Tax=Glossina austeni TaxID=7395 RepID=A0A1A9UID0_GLOAU